MREAFGLLVANGLLAGAGYGVLWALGVVATTRVRDALPALGLALLTGVAATMLLQILLLVLGFELRFRASAALCVVLMVAGFLWGRRAGGIAAPVKPALRRARLVRPEALVWIAALVAVAVFTVVAVRFYSVPPAEAFDDWAIWSKKALALYYFGGLEADFFVASPYSPMHQEYPILLPLLESFVFRAMEAPDTRAIHVEFLVLLAAFVGAAAYLCWRRAPGFSWAPILLLVAVAPFVHSQLVSGYADLPMSFFVAIGVLLLGLWLENGRAANLALGTLMLGAAGNTKFEGVLVGAIAYLVMIVILARARSWPRVRSGAFALGGFVALLLPWRIWVLAHPQIESFFSISRGLDPGYLLDHTELPREALDLIGANIADAESLVFLVPMALAVIAVCLVSGIAREVAAFYLAVSVAVIAGLVWIYWVDPTTWSPNRVIDSVTLIAVAGVIHIATVVFASPAGADGRPPPGRG